MKKKKTILGGAGFIDHNLTMDLVNKGCKCQVIDSLAVNNYKSKFNLECNKFSNIFKKT
jgi:hypothetical protein